MCLFTSTTDNVDIYWLNEVMLISPEGPSAQPEREVIISGLVRTSQEKSKLTFVQRGEIYALKDRSAEWQSTKDWLTEKILNHPNLSKDPRIKATGETGKLWTRFKSDFFPDKASVANLSGGISDIDIFCRDKTFKHSIKSMPTEPKPDDINPIFSIFSLTFKEPFTQLFRISFRTKLGLHKYHSQITLDVEGPDLAFTRIRQDIMAQVVDSKRKNKLRDEMDNLSANAKKPSYEIAIIGHPSMALTIENTENTKKLLNFKIDSQEIPMLSAASPARGVFFGTSTRTFTISAVATILEEQYPPKFFESLDFLKQQLKTMKDST